MEICRCGHTLWGHSEDDKPDRYGRCHMRLDDDSVKCPCLCFNVIMPKVVPNGR